MLHGKKARFAQRLERQTEAHPISPAIEAVLAAQTRVFAWVFTNSKTEQHTASSRMIAIGYDDYTVIEISGYSSTRMLARYTHPTEERKIGALDLPCVGTIRVQSNTAAEGEPSAAIEIAKLL